MWSALKLSVIFLLIYSVATATATDQAAMVEGVRSLSRAVLGACTRTGSPCTQAIVIVGSLPGALMSQSDGDKSSLQADGTRRPLDGSPRTRTATPPEPDLKLKRVE